MNKPKIRFKGFEEEWQKHPFSTIVTRHSSIKYDKKLPSVEYEDINSKQGTLNKDLSKKEIHKTGQHFVSGDILFGKLRPYLGNNLLATFEGIAVGDFWIYKNGLALTDFVYPFLYSKDYSKISNVSSGSKMPRSDWELLGKWNFLIPVNETEQRKIGDYFKRIDEMITEVEREINRLEKMKQASLQKMFPRPGETTPEIRFAGFSGDWQVASFSNIFTSLKNNTFSRAYLNFESGNVKNIHYGDVLIKYDCVVDISDSLVPYVNADIEIELNSFNSLSNGDIIIADTAEDEAVGKCVEIEGVDRVPAVSGLHTIAMRPIIEFSKYYLGYFLNSYSYHSQLLPLMQGIKVLSISRSAMADTFIFFPKSLKEQKAIGSYFRNLDSLLSAKRQKLVKLRNIKQACLDKMFVNSSL